MTLPAGLRPAVFGIAADMCEWPLPRCPSRAVELAHLHSTGSGGRPSAHTIRNTMAACEGHARITDGQSPPGPDGPSRYRDAIIELVGSPETWRGGAGTAHRIAKTLTILVGQQREALGIDVDAMQRDLDAA